VATIASVPTGRLPPFSVKVAVETPPEPASVAVPSEIGPAAVAVPNENVRLPAGATVPVAAFTVTLNCVDALWAMLAGLAVTVVVVATAGLVTITTTDPEEAAKTPLPA
jgi:hypothetical protein